MASLLSSRWAEKQGVSVAHATERLNWLSERRIPHVPLRYACTSVRPTGEPTPPGSDQAMGLPADPPPPELSPTLGTPRLSRLRASYGEFVGFRGRVALPPELSPTLGTPRLPVRRAGLLVGPIRRAGTVRLTV